MENYTSTRLTMKKRERRVKDTATKVIRLLRGLTYSEAKQILMVIDEVLGNVQSNTKVDVKNFQRLIKKHNNPLSMAAVDLLKEQLWKGMTRKSSKKT